MTREYKEADYSCLKCFKEKYPLRPILGGGREDGGS